MKQAVILFVVIFVSLAAIPAPAADIPAVNESPLPGSWDAFLLTINRYLGLPYVWGSTGLKSFDCSGFVWRVLSDNGIFIKRTTARKLYMMLPPADKQELYAPGHLVFFDDLKHVGFVSSSMQFYHAAASKGTTLTFFDPYWRPKIYGFRRIQTSH